MAASEWLINGPLSLVHLVWADVTNFNHHILIIGSICLCQPSVCATVSASINHLYPATDCAAATDISGVSGRWQLVVNQSNCNVYRTAAAGCVRWQLTHWDVPDCNGWGGEGGGSLDCGLWLACATLLRLMPQATMALVFQIFQCW